MIRCRLINTSSPLHLSKHTDQKYLVTATAYYINQAKEVKERGEDFIGVFRLDPIITPTAANEDFIIMKFHTPGISPTPGLISLEYDMIEDFLRDWEILGVYDIFENPEEPDLDKKKINWSKLNTPIDIDYRDVSEICDNAIRGIGRRHD